MNKKETKKDYCERLGVNYHTVLTMVSKGINEKEAVSKLIDSKNKLKDILTLAEEILGKPFNSRREVKEELKLIKVKDNNLRLKRLEVRLELYRKLRGTKYEFIIVNTDSFTYDGVRYDSIRKFTNDNKILIQDLYEKLFEEEKEIDKIIISCMDNPEYRDVIKPIIGTNKYTSITHLATVFNIDRRTYHNKLKDGMSFEDALTHCIRTRDKTRLVKAWIPGVYNEVVFKTIKELSSLTNISVRKLNLAMHAGKDRDEYIKETLPRENYYKQFRTVNELILSLDVPSTLYYRTLKDLDTIEKTVNYFLSIRFKLNGQIVMPTDKHLLPRIRLTNLQKMKLKQTLATEKDLDKRSYLAEEYLTAIGKL